MDGVVDAGETALDRHVRQQPRLGGAEPDDLAPPGVERGEKQRAGIVVVAVDGGAALPSRPPTRSPRREAWIAAHGGGRLRGDAPVEEEIGGLPVGLSLVGGGYVFSQRNGDSWKPITQGELRDRQWPGNLRAELSRDGKRIEIPPEPPETPPVVCFASGELTPFRLELGLPDLPVRWRLDGEIDGDVKRERRDAAP